MRTLVFAYFTAGILPWSFAEISHNSCRDDAVFDHITLLQTFSVEHLARRERIDNERSTAAREHSPDAIEELAVSYTGEKKKKKPTFFNSPVTLGIILGVLLGIGPDHLGTLVMLATGKKGLEAFGIGFQWSLGHTAGMGIVALIFCIVQKAAQSAVKVDISTWEYWSDYFVGIVTMLVAIWFYVMEHKYMEKGADGSYTAIACAHCEVPGQENAPVKDISAICKGYGMAKDSVKAQRRQEAKKSNVIVLLNRKVNVSGASVAEANGNYMLGQQSTEASRNARSEPEEPNWRVGSSRVSQEYFHTENEEFSLAYYPASDDDELGPAWYIQRTYINGPPNDIVISRLYEARISEDNLSESMLDTIPPMHPWKVSKENASEYFGLKTSRSNSKDLDVPTVTVYEREDIKQTWWQRFRAGFTASRSIESMLVGLVQGMACPTAIVAMSIIGRSGTSQSPLGLCVFIVIFVFISCSGSGLITAAWGGYQAVIESFISQRTIYYTSSFATFVFGVVWTVLNAMGVLHKGHELF
jgi:hypothetical protein